MNVKYSFLLIDDIAMNNMLTHLTIKRIYPNSKIVEFTDAQNALTYLKEQYSKMEDGENAILFLDIYMPQMDGWGFLKEFEQLNEKIKNGIKVYILSSSNSHQDLDKADSNKHVAGYIVKPFSENYLKDVLNNIQLSA